MTESTHAPQGETTRNRPASAALVAAVAGLTICVGSLLPWVTFGELGSASGVGGYGMITLVLGAVIVGSAVGLLVHPRAPRVLRWGVMGCAMLAGLVALVTLVRTVSVGLLGGFGMPGAGLFVVLAGAAVGLFAAVLVRRRS